MNKYYYPLTYLVLFLFSFFVNFYYANFGVEPMDSFVLFNGGFKVLNGLTPFKDYWLVTGPLMDYLNALFFLFLDATWTSYIIHSSLVNSIISIVIFILLVNFRLNKIFSFGYALMFSLLMYPNVGVPFVDHHATIFVLISFCLFVLGIKKNNEKYFFFIPLFLIFGFLCKQTPTTYGVFILFLLGLIYLLYSEKKKSFILSVIFGSIFSLVIGFLFLLFSKIPFLNFLNQYIYFASTIGDYRLSNWELDLAGAVHEFKFLLIPFIFSLYLNIIYYKIKKEDFLILLSINLFTILMLFHQLLTMNENYIFFLIPILTAFIHIYEKNIKNIFLFSIVFLCLYSVTKYHFRYNEHRKFHRLEKVNLNNAVEAEKINQNLKGLKWITSTYKDQPNKEIQIILDSINILKEEKGKFSIITDYLFIPVVLNKNDHSPNQWYHPGVSFPLKDNKHFEKYKNFFVNKLKREQISKIIIVGNGLEDLLLLTFDKNCFSKSQIGHITYRLIVKNSCEEFK